MIAALFAVLLASQDTAQMSLTVIGESGEGRECYLATEAKDLKSGLRHCDSALDEGWMSSRHRAATFVNRGILLTWNKQYRAALADFESALALNPELAEAFANRGNVHLIRHEYTSAIADFTRAIEGHSAKLFAVYYGRGLAYEGQKKLKAAIADFKKALDLNPNFTEASQALAFYHQLG